MQRCDLAEECCVCSHSICPYEYMDTIGWEENEDVSELDER